ncbi:MAG: CapA family protein [Microthrixaceae bacterium]
MHPLDPEDLPPVEPVRRPPRPARPTARHYRNRRIAVGVGALAALGLVVAGIVALAGGDDDGTDVAASGTASSSTTTGTPDPATSTPGAGSTPSTTDKGGTDSAPGKDAARSPEGSGNAVTLAFAGDSNFEGLDGALTSNAAGVLAPVAPLLSGADVAMVNLETVLGNSAGTPAAKTFTFRTPPQALDALKAAGVDVVTMANNHGMDYGPAGLEGSLAIRDATEFPILGVGRNEAEAYRPYVTEVKGQRIGIIAASDVFDDNLRAQWTATGAQPGIASAEEAHQERLAAAVRELRPQVDTLVVYLHYGTEKETCPNARQKELVNLLTGAGADIVVGTHAHRLQGLGYLGDRFVAYGLGNFAFRAASPAAAQSGVLEVTATGRRIDGFRWRPATISGTVPRPDPNESAGLSVMAERRSCAGLTDAPTSPSSTSPSSTSPSSTSPGGSR